MFDFQWPWLFVLLPVPWLLSRYLPDKYLPSALQSGQALVLPLTTPWQESENVTIADRRSRLTERLRAALLWLSWALLVTAVARPVWIDERGNVPISNRNIMVAVDLSGSMAQRDFRLQGSRISRLAATKKVASEFIEHRAGDRIGLILFGDHAYLQVPLTRDRKTVVKLLNEAELGLAGDRTALGDAIGLAVKKIREKPDEEHVLVLMTDGAATVGVSVEEAIHFAVDARLKVYTVGIGSMSNVNPEQKKAPDTSGGTANRTRNSQPANRTGGDLDEATLTAIAEQTGAKYFRARDIDELQAIYQELDKLEPVVDISKTWYPVKDLFYLPLSLAGLLLLLFSIWNVVCQSGWGEVFNSLKLLAWRKGRKPTFQPYEPPSTDSSPVARSIDRHATSMNEKKADLT